MATTSSTVITVRALWSRNKARPIHAPFVWVNAEVPTSETLRTILSASFTHKKHSSSAGLLLQAVAAPTLTPAVNALVPIDLNEGMALNQVPASSQVPTMNRFQRKLLKLSQNMRTSANGQIDNMTIAELLARRRRGNRPYFTLNGEPPEARLQASWQAR